jgi:hypothetical protein
MKLKLMVCNIIDVACYLLSLLFTFYSVNINRNEYKKLHFLPLHLIDYVMQQFVPSFLRFQAGVLRHIFGDAYLIKLISHKQLPHRNATVKGRKEALSFFNGDLN